MYYFWFCKISSRRNQHLKQLKEDIVNKYYKDKKIIDDLITQFKDEKNELELLIVCDMFLTGFDAPLIHTMYVDKPLRDHNLIQAISRVNRVWKDKPGGLIVDYIGIADDLKELFAHTTILMLKEQWYQQKRLFRT